MALSVQAYEQEMLRQYDAPGKTVRDKAQYLTELMSLRLAERMDENQQKALDHLIVHAITPRKEDGAPDFQSAEALFQNLVDIQTEMNVASGEAWERYKISKDPADRARAQDCGCYAHAMHGLTQSLSNAYLMMDGDYQKQLSAYEREYREYSDKQLAEHPGQKWREAFQKGYGYTEVMPMFMGAYSQALVTSMEAGKQAAYKSADEVEMDEGMNPTSYASRAIAQNGSALTREYMVATAQTQMMEDFEQIYDLETMRTYMETLAEMPIVKDNPLYSSQMTQLLGEFDKVDREKEQLHYYSTRDGYQDGNTFVPVPEKIRDEFRKFSQDISSDIAGKTQTRQQMLDDYARISTAKGLKGQIAGQKGGDLTKELTGYDNVRKFSELYYRMQSADKSGVFHKDSKEFKAMFAAVASIHKMSEQGYDSRDPIARAKMADLMSKAHQAADAYAEKEVYQKKKGTSLGVSRKNTALAILDLTTAGRSPQWDRVVDRRLALGQKNIDDPQIMMTKLRGENRSRYGNAAEQFFAAAQKKFMEAQQVRLDDLGRDREAHRLDGQLREKHPLSNGAQMAQMLDSLTLNVDRESRRTCFGIDPKYLGIDGLASLTPEQFKDMPADQQAIYTRLQAAITGRGSSMEIARGGMGGLTMLATLKFMQDNPDATFAQAMDPNAFKEQKAKAGKDLLDALDLANQDEPNMEPIAKIIAGGMKTVGDFDMKNEALAYLGYDPKKLSDEQARAIITDPANREKMIAFSTATLNFVQQAYQTINKPGIRGINDQSLYSKIDYSKTGPESVADVVKDCRPQADEKHAGLFFEAMRKELPPEVRDAYIGINQGNRMLQGGKNLGKYLSGTASPYADPQKTVNAMLLFQSMLEIVADGRKLTDPAMRSTAGKITSMDPSEIGIDCKNPASVETALYGSFPKETIAALRAKVDPPKPKLDLPVDEQVIAPSEPQTRPRSKSVQGALDAAEQGKYRPAPKPPKTDEPQASEQKTRPRSRSVHSATDAARQGKYRPAPKPPTM
ncbi:MAG: hypothetical protein II800_00315 [Lachnospiraceae bacterium]|nr:hypothetical protein [Lachnospiraceae bacterium]